MWMQELREVAQVEIRLAHAAVWIEALEVHDGEICRLERDALRLQAAPRTRTGVHKVHFEVRVGALGHGDLAKQRLLLVGQRRAVDAARRNAYDKVDGCVVGGCTRVVM